MISNGPIQKMALSENHIDDHNEMTRSLKQERILATELLTTAKKRWFKVSELERLLNPETSPLSISMYTPRSPPPSGTLLLYDRNVTRNYKTDGYNWIKKRNSPKVREDHVKLRVNGKFRVAGFYAHCQSSPTMHRRAYHILDPKTGTTKSPLLSQQQKCNNSSSSLVLLHYLDTSNAQQMNVAEMGIVDDDEKKRKKVPGNSTKPPTKRANVSKSHALQATNPTSDELRTRALVRNIDSDELNMSDLNLPPPYLRLYTRPQSLLYPVAPLTYVSPYQHPTIQMSPVLLPSPQLRTVASHHALVAAIEEENAAIDHMLRRIMQVPR